MRKDYKPRQPRASTHIKFFTEKYLWGSTRSELLPDERAVWVDFLCLGSMNFGVIECYSRDQLAQQLLISRELLDRSTQKFIKYGKIKRKYNKKDKKEIFTILNWCRFQTDYLTKRAKKSTSYEEQERSEKTEISDAENQPTLQERKGEDSKSDYIASKEIREDESEAQRPPDSISSEVSSPLHSTSTSYSEGEITKKDQFLSMLKACRGYPFDEIKDALLFDIAVTEYPKINIIKQTEKKIAWWKDRPAALKANPREQFQKWFKEESEFQDREGPQKIGEIMKEIKDPDRRNWMKKLVENTKKQKIEKVV